MADQREAGIKIKLSPETQAFFARLSEATLSEEIEAKAIKEYLEACDEKFFGFNPKALEEFEERWRTVFA